MPTSPSSPGLIDGVNPFPGHPAYFENLDAFQKYMRGLPIPLPPPAALLRPRTQRGGDPGKLLVCHDMMGGYVNDAHNPMWVMTGWSMTDIFVYFAHHRVSPPPRDWIDAGHRQGCKVLGTLIFESGTDHILLLTGSSQVSTAARTGSTQFNQFTTEYADALIDLCALRGFDGYLLNFEVGYPSEEYARVLAGWVSYITAEAKRRLGPRAEMIWYDSVTVGGQLRWQNQLNGLNSAYLLASDALFTNYSWYATTPGTSLAFLNSMPKPVRHPPDVEFGIDLWGSEPGRSTYGGGGLRFYRALDVIKPKELRLSAALFGPAWTFEKFNPQPRSTWWARETLLWVGRSTQQQEEAALRELGGGSSTGPTDVFHPMKHYFTPYSQHLPLTTYFSLGTGTSFSVEGRHVVPPFLWSDHGMVSPLPDLAMPCATGQSITTGESVIVDCRWTEEQGKVWFGGQSIQIRWPTWKPELGEVFVPFFTVDLGTGQDLDHVLQAEVTWLLEDSRIRVTPAGRSVHQAPVHSTLDTSFKQHGEVKTTVAGGQWVTTMLTFSETGRGEAQFGVATNFLSGSEYITIGAVSMRYNSLVSDSQLEYAPSGLRFAIDSTAEATGTLVWETVADLPVITLPVAPPNPSSFVPRWKPVPQSTLVDEPIVSEVTALLYKQKLVPRVLFWGTTTMNRMSMSWKDPQTKEAIASGDFVEMIVQGFDGAGKKKGKASTIRVNLLK